MSDEHEWGPWIEHDQSGCPVRAGTIVHAIYKDTGFDLRYLGWDNNPNVIDIGRNWVIAFASANQKAWREFVIRYRIRRPRALTQLIEMVESLPETQEAETT